MTREEFFREVSGSYKFFQEVGEFLELNMTQICLLIYYITHDPICSKTTKTQSRQLNTSRNTIIKAREVLRAKQVVMVEGSEELRKSITVNYQKLKVLYDLKANKDSEVLKEIAPDEEVIQISTVSSTDLNTSVENISVKNLNSSVNNLHTSVKNLNSSVKNLNSKCEETSHNKKRDKKIEKKINKKIDKKDLGKELTVTTQSVEVSAAESSVISVYSFFEEIQKLWNDMAKSLNLSLCGRLTDERKILLGKARAELKTIEHWQQLFWEVANSEFLLGRKKKDFKCSFDWLLIPDNRLKILEGKYRNPDALPTPTEQDNAVESQYCYIDPSEYLTVNIEGRTDIDPKVYADIIFARYRHDEHQKWKQRVEADRAREEQERLEKQKPIELRKVDKIGLDEIEKIELSKIMQTLEEDISRPTQRGEY